ncbi:lytic transglycosylase domain-containing protein [Pelistega europaea]|uniref:Lytic transglycosylase domain-containing protein n=1 Tax=Pelistega europaea TaxID=106147 RepID=A0A7Y4P614_9BURK|nr:lytic transglycosylase domain-containing protein [Pelistega europaea]NOL49305.1 lytic transglycosylase domain-containing protein [Pelistega europaea]
MEKSILRYFSWTLSTLLLLGCTSGKSTSRAIDEGQEIVAETPSHPRVLYRAAMPVDETARNVVVQAHEVMRQKRWDLLLLSVSQAEKDHELGAYPLYWYLRYRTSQDSLPLPVNELQRFLQQNPNTYVGERLKADWIVAAAKRGDFHTINKLGKAKVNYAPAQCAYYHAQAIEGKRINSAQALDGVIDDERCWDMVASLKNRQMVTLAQLQVLMREAVEYDSKEKAKRYAGIYFNAEDFNQFIAIMKAPSQWLATQSGQGLTAAQKELRAIAFSRLARQDRDLGMRVLESRGAELLATPDLQWAYSQFALMAALNLESRADAWYRKAGDIPLSDYNAAWRVRMALRQADIDWTWVSKTISLMSKQQQQESAWVYWKARALQALGNEQQAKALFKTLEKHYDFYGLLAQEALYEQVQLPSEPVAVTAQELARIKQNTGLQKAVALFRLGWRREAVAEWSYAIAGLNDRDLLAAAQWAKEEQIFDRVINTSLLTKRQISFQQRFIAPYEGRVEQQALKVEISPAWVYGLIRQESRFVPVARSGVGASGLMQLMPGTARLVAKKIGLQNFSMNQINDFETNTLLGTAYLRMILDGLDDNEVLATAGYNAGPMRAKRWRATLTHNVEGAIFAETIPFTETRLYVKHVMSNAIWYDAIFNQGKVASLKNRLGMIAPAP